MFIYSLNDINSKHKSVVKANRSNAESNLEQPATYKINVQTFDMSD